MFQAFENCKGINFSSPMVKGEKNSQIFFSAECFTVCTKQRAWVHIVNEMYKYSTHLDESRTVNPKKKIAFRIKPEWRESHSTIRARNHRNSCVFKPRKHLTNREYKFINLTSSLWFLKKPNAMHITICNGCYHTLSHWTHTVLTGCCNCLHLIGLQKFILEEIE